MRSGRDFVPQSLSILVLAGGVVAFTLFALAVVPGTASASTCFGKTATITSSNKVIRGTKDHDVIVVTGGGRHTVYGEGGNDRICGGPGADKIYGGRGNDQINGGGGNDWLEGERGNDVLIGGAGNDRLIGLNGDETLRGGPGNDDINGGPGADKLYGDGGNDVLRGGFNDDLLNGGAGRDIASYSGTPGAVTVDLRYRGSQQTHDGRDTLVGVEDLVGSAFSDSLSGNGKSNRIDGGPGYDYLDGGSGGNDIAYGGADGAECERFSKTRNCGQVDTPKRGTAVVLSSGLDGDSLVVNGDTASNRIKISREGKKYQVEETAGAGVYVGKFENSGCRSSNRKLAVCPSSGKMNLILATGGSGNDVIRIGAGIPKPVEVRLNGGEGSDTLFGGKGNDTLEAGDQYYGSTRGNDKLYGGAGIDSLFADDGADLLNGGPGDDLIVSSRAVCQGHRLLGGSGKDNASWAIVQSPGGTMRMQIGGRGGPLGRCSSKHDYVGKDVESLEGTKFADILIGTSGKNGFLGWGGADTFLGRGGRDYIDARDGQRDKKIDCGGGSAESLKDRIDPAPVRCR